MSDNHVNFLKIAGRKPHSVTFRVDRILNNSPELPIAFYEGDDDIDFYHSQIRKNIHADYYPIVCNGKDAVIEVHNYYRDNGKCRSGLYFIDMDYDDYFNQNSNLSNNVYMTDKYSIENYLFCNSSIEFILEKHLKVFDNDPLWQDALQKFEEAKIKFLKITSFLTCAVLSYRDITGNKAQFAHGKFEEVFGFNADLIPFKKKGKIKKYMNDIGVDVSAISKKRSKKHFSKN